ncbi:MAG: GTP 3',8-cyclase MoaA [Coriobacteriaceae bacterium]|nr:GTP 3',8-cyclase MoaA [Coriobacteriaceae bacterium]
MARDALGRTIDYLRISVTERCNFRCVYCMPEEGLPRRSHDEMLDYDDIERLVRIATRFGIRRLRLTGGEPLARRRIEDLIARLVAVPGIEAVALTTNGALLPAKAEALKAAGLSRVNISLDTLDPVKFTQVTRCGRLEDTLAGIDAALRMGFDPVKVNCVAVRSLEQDFTEFAKLTIDRPLHVRFIEFMPIGDTGCGGTIWTSDDIIPSLKLMEEINTGLAAQGLPMLVPAKTNAPVTWGPAQSFHIPGALGTVGFITPMSNHFCGACNRVRVTADGKLRPCLFSDREYDALDVLRNGSDDDVARILQTAIETKPADHVGITGTARGMSQIGG